MSRIFSSEGTVGQPAFTLYFLSFFLLSLIVAIIDFSARPCFDNEFVRKPNYSHQMTLDLCVISVNSIRPASERLPSPPPPSISHSLPCDSLSLTLPFFLPSLLVSSSQPDYLLISGLPPLLFLAQTISPAFSYVSLLGGGWQVSVVI